MANEISLESFDTNLVASMQDTIGRPSSDTAFRVALLGDWSGRSNRGLSASSAELARWRPLFVDRDNLDEVMARLGVKLRLSIAGAGSSALTLDFNRLEDFHPDRIYKRAELFQALRQTRAQLSNPKTFAQAAAEVREWLQLPEPEVTPPQKQASEPRGAPVSRDNLLDQVLEMSDRTAPSQVQKDGLSPDLRSLVQAVVRPYLIPNESQQESLISAVDRAIGGQMNAILHHPDFQALEAAWRALDFLVSRLETGTQLKIYLLDISFEELQAGLMGGEIASTGIYKLLVENSVETFGGEPWAVLVGNYVFDFSARDAELLKRLSTVAAGAIAPFVAAGTSRVAGCQSLLASEDPRDWKIESDAEAQLLWEELRRLPTACYLGLALPRFLLRLPYGSETDTTEEFSFEEMPESPGSQHECYLWANPAFAVAYLLIQGYLESGWDTRPGESQEIEGLPIHVYKVDGETRIKPCAEVLMTLRVAEKIIEHGPMPLITIKDTGTIRVGMFQSLALPAKPLRGRW